MIELISLHVPKCAGTSLTEALYEVYGKNAVHIQHDQLENPVSSFNMDPAGFAEKMPGADLSYLDDRRVVHGHFYIRKFDRFTNAGRITILRHPVDRLISHYFFWKYIYRPVGPFLHKYMLDNKLNIAEFARLPNLRYYYTRIFFRDLDMAIFDVIGRVEGLNKTSKAIAELLGNDFAISHANKTLLGEHEEERQAVLNNRRQLGQVRDLLKEDIDFYERWALK